MEHIVFISYKSEEITIAEEICSLLENNGVKCWIAPRDIPSGVDYDDTIEEAIKHANAVVVCFSERSSTSKWVKREISAADDANKIIIPIGWITLFRKEA